MIDLIFHCNLVVIYVYIIHKWSMSTVKTLEKCRKIMNLYESMHPSQHHKQPNKIDKEKVEIKKDRNK